MEAFAEVKHDPLILRVNRTVVTQRVRLDVTTEHERRRHHTIHNQGRLASEDRAHHIARIAHIRSGMIVCAVLRIRRSNILVVDARLLTSKDSDRVTEVQHGQERKTRELEALSAVVHAHVQVGVGLVECDAHHILANARRLGRSIANLQRVNVAHIRATGIGGESKSAVGRSVDQDQIQI